MEFCCNELKNALGRSGLIGIIGSKWVTLEEYSDTIVAKAFCLWCGTLLIDKIKKLRVKGK